VDQEGSFISRWRFEIKTFHFISEITTLNFQQKRRTVIFLSVRANGLYTVSYYGSNSDLFLHVSVIVKMLYYGEFTHTDIHTLTRMCVLNNQFPYPLHMMLNSLPPVVP
jgi:hypothetical protein